MDFIFNRLGTQAGYQLAGLGLTLVMAIFSGLITGLIIKAPIIEQVKDAEELFDDKPFWEIPKDSRETSEILF